MIISEKQIMKLMTYTAALISRMVADHAPIESINEIAKVLDDITNQQSEDLKEIE